MNEYLLYRLAKFFSRRLSRPAAYWLGKRIADLCFGFDCKGRRAVIANCRRILAHQGRFPESPELRRMARRTFHNFGKYLVDFFRFARCAPDEITALVTIENETHLRQALAADCGVIGITAHYGNWELAGALMVALGCPVTAVVLPNRLSKTNDLFQEQRQQRGIKVLSFGQAARQTIQALKHKEFVAMLADRDFTPHHDLIPFFGSPARLPSGPARLSWRTRAPVLPVFLMRRDDDRFLMRFYPPIFPQHGDGPESIRRIIRDRMEQEIGCNPTQWYIFDDFWPPAAPPNDPNSPI